MKTRLFSLFLALTCFCLPHCTQAQQYGDVWTQLTILSFEEFTQIFNGNCEEAKPLQAFPRLKNMERAKLITALFNPACKAERTVIEEFAQYVTQWGGIIVPTNTVAQVEMTYQTSSGTQVMVQADMIEEETPDGRCWIMKRVCSDALTVGDPAKLGYIGISDDEIGFLGFAHNAGGNPQQIAGKHFKPDYVSIFLYLTATGQWKYLHTRSHCYWVTLNDYRFKVGHQIETDKAVGGWLITELYKDGKLLVGGAE